MKLETVEWTDYWAQNTDTDKKRILMLGDSISRGIRPYFFRELKNHYFTSVATSRVAENPAYFSELKLLTSSDGFEYEKITLNNGLHGMHLTLEEYEAGYRKTVAFLKENFPKAKIYIVLSTPLLTSDKTAYDKNNEVCINRNEVARKIAQENGFEVVDFYSLADKFPVEYRSPNDGAHFSWQGYEALGKFLASIVD